jgi:putative hydrolase of the HAD superfamily
MDKQIKNIVFDFGGVLMDLDFENCLDGFRTAGFKDVDQYTSVYQGESFFKDFETGMISADQFRQEIKSRIDQPLTDEEVDALWLRMLKYIPAEKIDLLLELRQHYMVYLLSNTNPIHWDEACRKQFRYRGFEADDFFEEIYLSYEMHLVKPSKEIFQAVINCAGIIPSETMLIDDSAENCRVAESLGMKSYCPKPGEDWRAIL